jgi:glutamate-5-semialdehyde dehydrogenase
MDNKLQNIFSLAKQASREIALLKDDKRTSILRLLADELDKSHEKLIEVNRLDLAKMDKSNPLYDRLQLTRERLDSIANDIRNVAALPSPIGEVIENRTIPNGLKIRKVRVPFGVIGVIYEARPNVTFDVFSLCFRSGNACVLKGGSDAEASNKAIVELIHNVLETAGINPNCVTLLPSTHDATGALLNAVGYVDVCIPRGGKRLINFVRENAKIPVIETGAGVVSAYFDKYGDVSMGKDIITNAKTRRVSVCNALDTLLIHQDRLTDLPALCERLAEKRVEIYADERARQALITYPNNLIKEAAEDTYSTEWMDYKMGIKTVANIDEAIEHISTYGSGHSECIITNDSLSARKFQESVDAACVYVNAPTSFTDGAQFGLGAEIGISTQKLGPRGPMGLKEITTYKYYIDGDGQVRQ